VDTELIKTKFARVASYYDVVTRAMFSGIRARAIARLALQPGERVLDLGCGTGLSFALIEQAIGPEGRLVGVELSPAMLAKAREKIARRGWENITLLEANAEQAELAPESLDAVLSFYTHDILSSRRAVERVVRALRPGGRFVASGSRLAGDGRGRLIDPITRAYAGTAITRPLTVRPWQQLEDVLGPLSIEEHLLGSSYIAYGVKRP
jgi:ubiquinone/menaquinone biosynthesis C-methylase UbiE